MLKNFITIGWRNLLKNKGFSALNISGLAIGMASALIILLWVQSEIVYDNIYPDQDRLMVAWNKDTWDKNVECWSTTPKVLGPNIKKDFPEIEKETRVNWGNSPLFSVGDKRLTEYGTCVDNDFLTMFGFPFIQGNASTAFKDPYNIVVTDKLAEKLFGTKDAVGKIVKLDNKDNYTVSAVMKEFPKNSRFNKYEFLLSWSYMVRQNNNDSSWGNNSTVNYIKLKQNVNLAAFNKKIDDYTIKHETAGTTHLFLYPLGRMHLHGEFKNAVESGGGITTVRVFTAIAILILLIACINFMNLSTARSEKRAKEVGIRKVAGALKQSLVTQFLAESVMIAFIAGLLAVGIVEASLPAFNNLTQKSLSLDFSNAYAWIFLIGFILLTGILAGSYPAFFLSSFNPVTVLKGMFKKAHAPVTPRKILVVGQFWVAITLIICTIIIEQQIKYAQGRENGYNRNNLVYVYLQGDIEKNYQPIKNDLLGQGVATAISKTSSPITQSWSNTWGFEWKGKPVGDKTIINDFCSDGNLVKTVGMKLVEGRDIDVSKYPGDSTAAVLNEACVKAMGFKHPIGEIIKNGEDYHVVGVVKDFIMESPYDPIRPIVIRGPKGWFSVIHIKLNNTHSTQQNLAAMEKIFKKYNPEYPFDYHFTDKEYEEKFANEQLTATLAALFGGLTILIACLGLFGLATYMAENRIKEIGVRKVLGASVAQITSLLSKDFLTLVIISVICAVPVAWYAMHEWLKDFNYRTPIQWWVFVLAGLTSVVIAVLTVSYQAIKAAVANPVKSLRTE
ncbi:MAG TPA: ABC transporter permease [Chitinophagaceae bacterium]|nr:ABC transporter permease [Chitinophagaceae bacterium]